MIGRNPICASVRAANSPHGPAPITTGRQARRGRRAADVAIGHVRRAADMRVAGQAGSTASSSATVTSSV